MNQIQYFLKLQTSDATRIAYTADLTHFNRFLEEIPRDVTQCSIDDILAYKKSLEPRYSEGSINRKMACIRAYFRYLLMSGVISQNVAQHIKLRSSKKYTPTEGLTDEETRSILAVIDLNSESGILHNAVLHTLFYLGLRRSELCSLKVTDLYNGVLTVIGKGNTVRKIPVPTPALDAINNYLFIRKSVQNEFLFSSSRGGNSGLHPNSIVKIVSTYAKKAGITKKVTPHTARTTCVSNALENGASILQVQYLGGWSNLDMVLRYDRRRQEIKNSAAFKISYK